MYIHNKDTHLTRIYCSFFVISLQNLTCLTLLHNLQQQNTIQHFRVRRKKNVVLQIILYCLFLGILVIFLQKKKQCQEL